MEKSLITNWNNYPVIKANVYQYDHEDQLHEILQKNSSCFIARGAGRCYGDASLAKNIISTTKYNNFISFDRKEGILSCQAGVTLEDILKIAIPSKWFLPVTPGTKFITIGGAVASDVHGKNHHKDGSFSNHILSMTIFTGTGDITSCSKENEPDLFYATCGGMGLTGVILSVTIRLKKINNEFITRVTNKASDLNEIFDLFEQNEHKTYSMAWIDCFQKGNSLGRSILYSGEHSSNQEITQKKRQQKKEFNLPFNLPSFTLNKLSISAFNFLYYYKHSNGTDITDYNTFFYPLDAIHHWNRMYGKMGFVQYQFVLPLSSSKEGLNIILKKISQQNFGSFLGVLKLFGEQNDLISFPMRGYTLALDFPIRKNTFKFLNELDAIVHDYQGRIYLSKDARAIPELLKKGYPRLNEFLKIVNKYNPDSTFYSEMAKRLGLK